jgi:vacuolar-type H+-ATPase subunit H
VQELLRTILDVEAEARGQLAAAQQDCEGRVRAAEEQGREQIRRARQAREAIARAVEEQLVADAQEEAQRIADSWLAKTNAMRALAEPCMERAVETVLQCVLGRSDEDDS